ncbi:MAG: aryl-sulfate sulfotransferase [Nitrososphaerota archaeon]|nr:aryl-sulfate sulfotransferase [Candidatus Bathyarchaeota archaeon]MDW8023419.1 aryl-sulfate sulfotransferase [Nitrososphaerota archaeon]
MSYRVRPTGVTVYEKGKAYEGYTLFAPMGVDTIYLVDIEGKVVHSWKIPYPAHTARLLNTGNILYMCRTEKGPIKAGGKTGIVIEATWEGEIVWKYEDDTLHHDCFRSRNGNTLLMCWEKVPEEIANRVKGGLPFEGQSEGKIEDKTMWGDKIIEVNKDGKIVWEWHAYEHLDPEKDYICPLCGRLEWTHGNAIFETKSGDVLTSFRQTNTVGIIDKKSGDWKWKWGRGVIYHQHDPTELPNGNILIFDNGAHRPEPPLPGSRVVEVDPKENKIVWEYSDPNYLGFYSHVISGAQRLPNGNTLICEGNRGRIFEVTPEKEIVWEYYSPFESRRVTVHEGRRGTSYDLFRAYKYGKEYPGLANL